MASLRKPAQGQYTACFRFDGRHYQRSLKTNEPANAQAVLGRIKDTLHLLATGRLAIPPGVDPGDFIVTSGAEKAPRSATKVPTLEQFLLEYRANHPAGTKAENTLRTEQIHINHFLRLNKGLLRRSIGQLNFGHFQQYIGQRLKEGASPTTVDKEVATWRYVLGHARKLGHLAALPTEDLVLPKSAELPPHRTIEEVRAIIARKGLTEAETEGLWDAIYLTTSEIGELLALVRERARYPWIYPMFCLVAYTGMRRSSMLLSRVDEIDLGRNLVFVRSRKFERGLTESRLEVPVHPNLKAVMADWLGRHPGGQYTITPDGQGPPTKDAAHHHFRHALAGTKYEVVRGFHVFRHSMCSNLASKGVAQAIIDSVVGHQTEEMRRRYRHLFPKDRQSGIERLDY
jgi:integrase